MNTEDLTPDEVEMIRRRRAQQQSENDARVFQQRAISTANDFLQWSAKAGYGLTFSTFVNQFDYQEEDLNEMYRAVERILSAARPQ